MCHIQQFEFCIGHSAYKNFNMNFKINRPTENTIEIKNNHYADAYWNNRAWSCYWNYFHINCRSMSFSVTWYNSRWRFKWKLHCLLSLIKSINYTNWCSLLLCRFTGQFLILLLLINLGEVVYTYVPLSPSSITWYRTRGRDALQLGR